MRIKPVFLLFFVTLLVGCQENIKQNDIAHKVSESAKASKPQRASPPVTHKKTLEEKRLEYKQGTMELVLKGEQALTSMRLTTPSKDNANRYFKQALARDPKNYRATLGLLNILQTYTKWAWQAAQEGEYGKADHFLASARLVKPHFSEIERTQARIEVLKQQRQKAASKSGHSSLKNPRLSQKVVNKNQYLLPKNLFTLSDDEIIAKIQPIIDKVAASKSEVVIKWPNDKQARLLYQIINSRVSEFRVRAMIYHRSDYSIELHKVAE